MQMWFSETGPTTGGRCKLDHSDARSQRELQLLYQYLRWNGRLLFCDTSDRSELRKGTLADSK